MKNRKSILVVFAILALLCLGIGYAALSDTLEMTGTLLADGSTENVEEEARFDVDWVRFRETSTKSGNVSLSNQTMDIANDSAAFTVSGFTTKGDCIWVQAEFQNVSPEDLAGDVLLEVEIEGEGKEKFDIAYIVESNDADKDLYTYLEADELGLLTIAISLKETLLSTDSIELTINVTITAVDSTSSKDTTLG